MFSPNFASSPSLADIAAVTDNNRGTTMGSATTMAGGF